MVFFVRGNRGRFAQSAATDEIEQPEDVPTNIFEVIKKRRLQKAKEEKDGVSPEDWAKRFDARSLFLFEKTNPFRAAVIRLVDVKWFDRVVLFLILANSIALALSDPLCDNDENNVLVPKPGYVHECNQEIGYLLTNSEIVFTILFSLEMVLKIIATGGILHRFAYFRDTWNWLDATVVVLSWVGYLPGSSNFSSLRTFRVLRPLRTMRRIPGMAPLVASLLKSLRPLSNVMLLCCFMFFIFGILGVQLWVSGYHTRCVYVDGPLRGLKVDDEVCGPDAGRVCGEVFGWKTVCQNNTAEANFPNPPGGAQWINFDNIGSAFLLIFQCISMEGWTDIMYMTADAWIPLLAYLYFPLLILVGSFFMINLALAVIAESFDRAMAEADEQSRQNESKSKAAGSVEEMSEVMSRAKSMLSRLTVVHETAVPLHVRCWHQFRAWCLRLAKKNWFGSVVMAFIIVNTLFLSLEYHDQELFEQNVLAICPPPEYCEELPNKVLAMPQALNDFLEIANLILTFVFLFEMLVKLCGLGVRGYIKERMNVFDAFIVVVSLVELGFADSGIITVFRAFRLFRVFKLVRSWTSLRKILLTLQKGLVSIGPLTVVLVLLIFIFSILGMELFGGAFRFENESYEIRIPRSNFDSFFPSKEGFGAVVTIFQVLTGENWNDVMYDAMLASGPFSVVYFTVLVTIGIYIIMNLFLAVLLQGFQNVDDEMDDEKKRVALIAKKKKKDAPLKAMLWSLRLRLGRQSQVFDDSEPSPMSPPPLSLHRAGTDKNIPGTASSKKLAAGEAPTFAPPPSKTLKAEPSTPSLLYTNETGNKTRTPVLVTGPTVSGSFMAVQPGMNSRVFPNDPSQPHIDVVGSSLMIFSPTNPIRVLLVKLVNHKAFDNCILVAIIVSSILMMVEHPAQDPNSDLASFLAVMDMFFVALFTTEMALKIVANGLCFQENAYLRDSWNCLDGAIVLISIISLAAKQLKSIRALRTFRALRPLRIINRNPDMKLTVNCLLSSIPSMMNVAVVCLLFFVIFGILGVQLCKGSFYSCDIKVRPDGGRVADMLQCFQAGGTWSPRAYSFDNLAIALLTLFEVSTLEGWLLVMADGVDSVGPGMQPLTNNVPLLAAYFVGFIVIGAFFVLRLFIGVVIDNYNRLKMESDGVAYLTRAQKDWIDTQKRLLKQKPLKKRVVPSNVFRRLAYLIVTENMFDLVIMGVICTNVLVMALNHHGMSADFAATLYNLSIVFTTIYTVEFLLKVVGLGPRGYYKDAWNCFDFIILVGGFIGLFFTAGVGATILRVFRIARLFRLIKTAEGVKQLLDTLLFSLPSMVNIGALLGLVFCIYGTLGLNFFHNAQYGDWITRHANFSTFGLAIVTLFRMATGENWNGIMHDAMRGECKDETQFLDECGGVVQALLFFLSFCFIITFIMLNLFIAVILDNFNTTSQNRESALPNESLEEFRLAWATFDPDATQMISKEQLVPLIKSISQPLGVGSKPPSIRVLRVLNAMDLHVVGGQIHFMETLTLLAKRIVGVHIPPEMPVGANWERRLARLIPTKFRASDEDIHELRIELAVGVISYWYQIYRLSKKTPEEIKPQAEALYKGQKVSYSDSSSSPHSGKRSRAQSAQLTTGGKTDDSAHATFAKQVHDKEPKQRKRSYSLSEEEAVGESDEDDHTITVTKSETITITKTETIQVTKRDRRRHRERSSNKSGTSTKHPPGDVASSRSSSQTEDASLPGSRPTSTESGAAGIAEGGGGAGVGGVSLARVHSLGSDGFSSNSGGSAAPPVVVGVHAALPQAGPGHDEAGPVTATPTGHQTSGQADAIAAPPQAGPGLGEAGLVAATPAGHQTSGQVEAIASSSPPPAQAPPLSPCTPRQDASLGSPS